MKSRRLTIIAATALAAVGGGAALAATQEDEGKEREDAILADAAERLDVETAELRTALSDAQQAQLDQAVEEGKLTQEEADRIKQHMQESGRVLGGPGGPLGGPHGGPHGGPPPFFDEIAESLGISEEELHSELRGGKSLRQVARAHGSTIAELKSVAKAAIEKQIADDVASDRISESQADQMREHLPEMLKHLGKKPRMHAGPGPGPGGPGRPGSPPMGPPMGPPPGVERAPTPAQ